MKRLIKLGKDLKQILKESNKALANKGLAEVGTLAAIGANLKKLDINYAPYFISREIMEIDEYNCAPDGIIRKYCFRGCNQLESVRLLKVTELRYGAFYQCSSLTSVTFGSNLVKIDGRTFYQCSKLAHIYLYATTPPSLLYAISINYTIPSQVKVHVPIGSGAAYKAATNWSKIASRIIEDL